MGWSSVTKFAVESDGLRINSCAMCRLNQTYRVAHSPLRLQLFYKRNIVESATQIHSSVQYGEYIGGFDAVYLAVPWQQ